MGTNHENIVAQGTVRDVLCAWNAGTTLSMERMLLLWEAITPKWPVADREAFLDAPDSKCLLALGGELRSWLHKVGEKYLKMLASEYTCLREPRADTGRLTFATQSLMHEEELQDVMVELIDTKNASLAVSITRAEKPVLRQLLLTTVCLVTLYHKGTIDEAADVVIPLLIHSSHTRGRYLSRLIGVLAFLLPAQNFRESDVADRLQCVWQQLSAHGEALGLCVSEAALSRSSVAKAASSATSQTCPAPPPAGFVPLSVDVLYRHKRELPKVQLWCADRDDADEVEWREAAPVEVFEAVITAGARYRKKVREGAEANKGARGASSAVQLANPGFFMNALHAMLRFQGPLADRMQEEGHLREMAEHSAGWVPLRNVAALLSEHLRKCQQEAPDDVETIVRQVLEDHDHFGRFQVGLCDVPSSPFAGRVCCRASYAHRLRQPLFRDTVLTPAHELHGEQAAASVPFFGWVHLDSAVRTLQQEPGLVCYDNIPFVAVFASSALGRFRRYKETVLQSHQYDEKLKSDSHRMMFAEVSLRAMVRDTHCQVYSCASRTRWYVEPRYTYEAPRTSASAAGTTEETIVRKSRVLPKLHFTGRRVTFIPQQSNHNADGADDGEEAVECERVVVRAAADVTEAPEDAASEFAEVVTTAEAAADVEGSVISTQRWVLRLDRLPPSVVSPLTAWTSLLSLLRRQGATDARELPRTVFPFVTDVSAEALETAFADYPRAQEAGTAAVLDVLHGADKALPVRPRLMPGRLSLDDFELALQKFVADPEQYMMLMRVPKVTPEGAPYANRTAFLKELKECVRGEGLTLTLRRTTAETAADAPSAPTGDTGPAPTDSASPVEPDVFEVRKKFLWKRSELEKLVSDLGLGSKVTASEQLSLIRTALTRECENKDTNYERLEFVGDAIMDFVVSLDACLVKSYLLRTEPVLESQPGDKAAAKGGRSAALQLNVVMTVCRNSVIAQLLPTSITRHLTGLYELNAPAEKVKADMFEALVGAVYEMGLGMETVRHFLMHLFSHLKTLCTAPDVSPDVAAACEACPYTSVDDVDATDLFRFPSRLIRVIPPSLRKFITPLADDDTLFASAHNTHVALVGLPRIQAKGYATHFTTGTQYSYRRLHSRDASVLWHRILRLTAERQAVFVNETVTRTTHLVFDYDGEDIRSFNALRHFWQWYREQFACAAAMLVLDCTGPSPSKQNAMKCSCHIHFPQIVLTLPQLGAAQTLFRDYLKAQHERDKRLMGTMQAALLNTSTATASLSRTPMQQAQVLFSTARVRALARQWPVPPADDDDARHALRFPRTCIPLVWHFCAGEVLVELSHVCRAWRSSVLQYAEAHLSREIGALCRSFGVRDDTRLLAPRTDVPTGSHVVMARAETTMDNLVVVEDTTPALEASNPPNRRWLVPGAWLKTNAAMIEGIAVDTVVDASLEKSKKLRMYLCDKCDMKYGAERRPLLLQTVITSTGRVEQVANDKTHLRAAVGDRTGDAGAHAWCKALHACAETPDEAADGDVDEEVRLAPLTWTHTSAGSDEAYPVLASETTVLRLTSLRSPSYRDVSGRLYEAWDGAPSADPLGDTSAPLCDELPTFCEALLGERRVAASAETLCVTQWGLWVNAFTALVPKNTPDKFKHAVSPSWWAYDTATLTATFYVATEPVFAVPDCGSLHEALRSREEGGRDGMRLLARWLVPHLSYTGAARVEPQWTEVVVDTKVCRDYMPLFVSMTGGKKKPSAVAAANKVVAQVTKRSLAAAASLTLNVASVRYLVQSPYASVSLPAFPDSRKERLHALRPIRALLRATLDGMLDGGGGCLVLWETEALMMHVHDTVSWACQIGQQTTLAALPAVAQRVVQNATEAVWHPLGFGAVLFLHETPETCALAIRTQKMALRQLFVPAAHFIRSGPRLVVAHVDVRQALRDVLS